METNQENINLEELTPKIEKWAEKIDNLTNEISKAIVGQKDMIRSLLTGLFTGGHILLEGVPGLAKTLAVKTLAQTINADFKRIQFTPDLLPSDLIGTLIYNQKEGRFATRRGPIFSNIILADEINRAPSKVQSALLESMQELQVTIGNQTYKLDEPFMVFATENPIEHEGTYPLPEAQVDRFMLKVKIDYPKPEEESLIVRKVVEQKEPVIKPIIEKEHIKEIREIVSQIYIDEEVVKYIIDIVNATRHPEKYRIDPDLIAFGASPRASIYLALVSKAYAFIQGKPFVTPDFVRSVADDVLRHRIILTYEAEAEEKTPEEIIGKVFDTVEVP
jgi:MoxR-like ATPase